MMTPQPTGRGNAAQSWADQLTAWTIPQEILDQAPQTPWVFPPDMFTAPAPGASPRSRSSELAAEALGGGGAVLDVGCGGGAAAFAVAPPATSVIGTDRQADMVLRFAETAVQRDLPVTIVAGGWPEVADRVPQADVVVCNNVLYNVADLVPFATALTQHARRRVVIEITDRHPQTTRAPLWKQFWGIDRPDGPTASLAAEVIADSGVTVRVERSTPTVRDTRMAEPVEAAFWTRQLCLPPERIGEVGAAVAALPFPAERTTLWWDVG